jgi:two-component system sensor histidine kinase PilS (NtrC family)
MTIVLRESERLNKTIGEFLRFVRPQEKRAVQFDIAASVNETLDLLANSAELRKDHEIRREINPPSFTLVGDGDQIRQVFWNIALNAFRAMPGGGILAVRATVVDGEYRIVFADNGRGMTESDQRRLFQPFRTGFPTGTGLGMAISYRIVQEHGGEIHAANHPTGGAMFTVELPTRPGAERAKE